MTREKSVKLARKYFCKMLEEWSTKSCRVEHMLDLLVEEEPTEAKAIAYGAIATAFASLKSSILLLPARIDHPKSKWGFNHEEENVLTALNISDKEEEEISMAYTKVSEKWASVLTRCNQKELPDKLVRLSADTIMDDSISIKAKALILTVNMDNIRDNIR